MITFLYNLIKHKRDPCKDCIVKATCTQHHNCERFLVYIITLAKIDNISNYIDVTFLTLLFIFWCISVIIILPLGAWKFVELLTHFLG